jgi:hypothetical protein
VKFYISYSHFPSLHKPNDRNHFPKPEITFCDHGHNKTEELTMKGHNRISKKK